MPFLPTGLPHRFTQTTGASSTKGYHNSKCPISNIQERASDLRGDKSLLGLVGLRSTAFFVIKRKGINCCSNRLKLQIDPPGPVILLAHSMGGLLAADAALSQRPEAARIIGITFFDVPFLGMHPHVILSGIASLFPKDEKPKSEKEMNNHSTVQLPDTPSPFHSDKSMLDTLLIIAIQVLSPCLMILNLSPPAHTRRLKPRRQMQDNKRRSIIIMASR